MDIDENLRVHVQGKCIKCNGTTMIRELYKKPILCPNCKGTGKENYTLCLDTFITVLIRNIAFDIKMTKKDNL